MKTITYIKEAKSRSQIKKALRALRDAGYKRIGRKWAYETKEYGVR